MNDKPTIIVGVETLAILFQGGTVNLNDAVLIPDSTIHNAARAAMNIASPPMQDGDFNRPNAEVSHSRPEGEAATKEKV